MLSVVRSFCTGSGRQVYDDAGLFSDSEISELTAAVNVAEEETGGILCF